jgi:hypothetical protein
MFGYNPKMKSSFNCGYLFEESVKMWQFSQKFLYFWATLSLRKITFYFFIAPNSPLIKCW